MFVVRISNNYGCFVFWGVGHIPVGIEPTFASFIAISLSLMSLFEGHVSCCNFTLARSTSPEPLLHRIILLQVGIKKNVKIHWKVFLYQEWKSATEECQVIDQCPKKKNSSFHHKRFSFQIRWVFWFINFSMLYSPIGKYFLQKQVDRESRDLPNNWFCRQTYVKWFCLSNQTGELKWSHPLVFGRPSWTMVFYLNQKGQIYSWRVNWRNCF